MPPSTPWSPAEGERDLVSPLAGEDPFPAVHTGLSTGFCFSFQESDIDQHNIWEGEIIFGSLNF